MSETRGTGGLTEEYWQAYRRRARRRASAAMAIVLMPILIVFAVIKVIGPHDGYRAGDARSEPGFWLAVGLAFSIVWVTILIGSIRELRRTDSNDLPER